MRESKEMTFAFHESRIRTSHSVNIKSRHEQIDY